MIHNRHIDQTFSDLRPVCGGVREDYFGLLYLEHEHNVPREKAVNQIAFGGNDYGVDGFHFDEEKRNLYIYQFKYSNSHTLFKESFLRLIESGMQRIFIEPNKDDYKNQVLMQLRACLLENRAIIDQIFFRFVFTGDAGEADRSLVLDKLREDLENKKYKVDQFFKGREVGFVVEFRSSSGRTAGPHTPPRHASFEVPLTNWAVVDGPAGQKMYIGFMRLADLNEMHNKLGQYFFDSNIRYGLGESEAVNRAISNALKQIILDRSEHPSTFAFNHNGVTLYAEKVEPLENGFCLTTPRLLNGAQTVTTLAGFLKKNKDNPKLLESMDAFQDTRVLCKIITNAETKFVTRVTINNNRQNPVEPWNLHANDLIQLELQQKLRDDLGIYYERQENAFNQLSTEDLEDYGITEESKAIQMLKLTQTFVITDGQISRMSNMRRIFEEDKIYEQVFRQNRVKADSRHIVLCYKIQNRLRRLSNEILQKGQNKYSFVSRARYLLWALLCQGLLNHKDLDDLAENYGTAMSLPYGYMDTLTYLATARVRILLLDVMKDKDYLDKVSEDNLGFLRTDRAFEKCMENAYERWGWVHKKL
jgi:hypothetical protein